MTKLHSFLHLLFSCFPFVRSYRLRKKIKMKRKRMRNRLHREENRYLRRYIMLESVRRS